MKYIIIVAFVLLSVTAAHGQYIYPTDPVTGTPDYSRPPIGHIQPQPNYQPYQPPQFYTPQLQTPNHSGVYNAYERGLRTRQLQMQNELLEQELMRRSRGQ